MATANIVPFPVDLVIKKTTKVSSIGRPIYELLEPFRWRFHIIPKGFHTDFASIPEFFFLLKADDPDWKMASVVHDWACKQARKNIWSMKFADEMFYQALLDDGASKLTALIFYNAVRLKHTLLGEY